MKAQNPIGLNRLILVIVLPLVAFVLQSMFWDATIKPFAWFLFFPAVFFSSWVGGLSGGVIATVISTALAWWFFVPPERAFALENPFYLVSIAMFVGMGFLFGYTQERIKRANRKTAAALAAARAANEQLQGANDKITQLYKKTLELDQLKNQLFANVSHELRTPLALILGPVAKRLAAGDLSDELRRDLEVVDRNARLLYRHVSDLLDVAKLEAGRMHTQYARVDLAHLARFVASHFEVLAVEKRIRYTVDTPDVLLAQVDSEKCQRILLNLLSNAFKFTSADGVVALTLSLAGARAVMRVQDNGPGVPAAMREAVFERFRQVEGGAERRFGGTGLGLAIVKEFVGLQSGSVAVEEAPGGGAAFTVTLPLLAAEGTEILATPGTLDEAIDRQALDELRTRHSATAPPPPALAADAPLVLVVEDNPDMNAFVAEAMGRHYRVVTAFDGQEGLRKALEIRPDLIVSDVMMPRMSGDQMVGALRRQRQMDDVPILLLTAKADDELRVKLLKEGVQDYIYKPFSVEELLARVGGLVSSRKRKEASLREAYGLLHAVTESIPDAVFVKDSTGRYLMINKAGARLLGQPAEQVLGKRDTEFLAPEAARKVMEEDREVMAGGESRTREETELLAGIDRALLSTKVPFCNPQGEIKGVLGIRRDITERKRAEERLRLQGAAMESAANGIVITDRGGTILWVNPAFTSVSGYAAEEAIGRNPRVLKSGKHDQAFYQNLWGTILAGRVWRGEIVNRRKDGSLWTEEMTITPVRNGRGEIANFIAIKQDITERKLVEQELRLLQAITLAVSGAPDLDTAVGLVLEKVCEATDWDCGEAWVPSTDGSCLSFLTAWHKDIERQREFEHTTREVTFTMGVGLPGRIWKSRKPEWLRDVSVNGQTFLRAEVALGAGLRSGVGVPIVAENDFLAVLVFLMTQEREEDTRFLGLISSVAAQLGLAIRRKRAEEALRASERQLSLVYDNVADIIFYLGVEPADQFRFLSVNPTFLKATGLSESQMVGKLVGEVIPEPSLTMVLGKYKEAIRDKKIVQWEETSVYPAGTRHGEVSITPILDSEGHCTNLIGAVHDITERKQAEEEIRRLNEELERRVVERTAQLEAANKELETFSYSVSHDLRAPLRSIDGFSQALLDDCADRLDAYGKRYLKHVRESAQHMGELIDDLLNLSRVTRAELRRERVDLSELARAVLVKLQESQPDRRVEVVVHDGLIAQADPRLLDVALTNLLGNAWKFTGKRASARIELAVKAGERPPVYLVRDNGAGFDAAYAGKLFGVFQRLHAAHEFEGTGIGLATVQRIVGRHGGRVWAEGEVDRGATFYFTLEEGHT